MYRKKSTVVSIPLEGPCKPIEITFDMGKDGYIIDLMFPLDSNCSNICRTVAEESLTCAICMEKCQQQSGLEWYTILGWEGCHLKCWKDLCFRYHKWLKNRENNLSNFCKFMS